MNYFDLFAQTWSPGWVVMLLLVWFVHVDLFLILFHIHFMSVSFTFIHVHHFVPHPPCIASMLICFVVWVACWWCGMGKHPCYFGLGFGFSLLFEVVAGFCIYCCHSSHWLLVSGHALWLASWLSGECPLREISLVDDSSINSDQFSTLTVRSMT